MSFTKKDWIGVILSILICEAAGMLGSLFTAPAIPNWYANIERSPLNPPSWVFAPVWTALFALMGIAVFLVWRKRSKDKAAKTAVWIFAGQLALNVLWSILFFGLQDPLLALLDIVALWTSIILTIVAFVRLSKPAAWLLAPYLLWVSFAIYLNYSVVVLN